MHLRVQPGVGLGGLPPAHRVVDHRTQRRQVDRPPQPEILDDVRPGVHPHYRDDFLIPGPMYNLTSRLERLDLAAFIPRDRYGPAIDPVGPWRNPAEPRDAVPEPWPGRSRDRDLLRRRPGPGPPPVRSPWIARLAARARVVGAYLEADGVPRRPVVQGPEGCAADGVRHDVSHGKGRFTRDLGHRVSRSHRPCDTSPPEVDDFRRDSVRSRRRDRESPNVRGMPDRGDRCNAVRRVGPCAGSRMRHPGLAPDSFAAKFHRSSGIECRPGAATGRPRGADSRSGLCPSREP